MECAERLRRWVHVVGDGGQLGGLMWFYSYCCCCFSFWLGKGGGGGWGLVGVLKG